jgi:hypothetical protein
MASRLRARHIPRQDPPKRGLQLLARRAIACIGPPPSSAGQPGDASTSTSDWWDERKVTHEALVAIGGVGCHRRPLPGVVDAFVEERDGVLSAPQVDPVDDEREPVWVFHVRDEDEGFHGIILVAELHTAFVLHASLGELCSRGQPSISSLGPTTTSIRSTSSNCSRIETSHPDVRPMRSVVSTRVTKVPSRNGSAPSRAEQPTDEVLAVRRTSLVGSRMRWFGMAPTEGMIRPSTTRGDGRSTMVASLEHPLRFWHRPPAPEWEEEVLSAARRSDLTLMQFETDTGQVVWSWSARDDGGPRFLTRRVALAWMADVLERGERHAL